jgi:geranylgeranylglycerol-phosphate geranylgeranyltransferase
VKLLGAIRDILSLIRAVNCLIAAAGVMVGAYLTHSPVMTPGVLFATVAVFLVCAGGNALNDLCDVEIDRISHPERVLVRGKLGRPAAISLIVALPVIGLVFAAITNSTVLTMGVIGVWLTLSYDLWLKRVPGLGNLMVACLAGLTFLVGGAAADPSRWTAFPGPLVPAILALFFHLIREIVKDIEDMEGDQRAGIRSLPARIGVDRAVRVAVGLLIGLMVLTYVPYHLKWYGPIYLVIGLGLAEGPSLVLVSALLRSRVPRLLKGASISLKIGMVFGLLALVVG